MDKRRRDLPAARQPARSRLQRWMEREDGRSREPGRQAGRVLLGLAVATLALGLAVLALATQLQVNDVQRQPPQVALAQDGDEPAVQILRSEPDLRWSDLRLDGNCTLLLNGNPLSETPQAPVLPGDVLSCETGETLQIFSQRERGGAILYQAKFPE